MGLFTRLALRLAGLQIHCGLLPGAALISPCPGYKVPAVCEPVARQMRSIASGKFSLSARCSRGRRLSRLARACMITPSERTGQFSLMAVRMPCPGLGFRACSVDPLHRTAVL
ncbi:hypothetical protein, partial [Klebsiella michiganensis]